MKKSEMRKVFHAMDKQGGGRGYIKVKDIKEYCRIGKTTSRHHSSSADSDDEEIDRGVWGSSPIVDLQMSTSEMEESRLQTDGYEKVLSLLDLPANLNEGVLLSSPIILWYRRRSAGGSGVRLKPIVDIVISEKLIGSALVIAGYTCLNKSTNKGNVVGKSQYIWIRRAGTPDEEERDAIVSIAITHGNAKDLSDGIHRPPGRGFIHVTGDLNRRALFARSIYLWFRPVTPRSAEKDWRYGVPEEERNYELECSARRAIRQFVR